MLTDFEWSIIQLLLPNKPRDKPRTDDRTVLNGIDWRLPADDRFLVDPLSSARGQR